MFPEPRHVEHQPGPGSLSVRSSLVDASLPPQGYELIISEHGTTIRHADDAGLRYARQTLAALDVGAPVRAQRIVDHPDFAHRGFMLDISRDRVPRRETLDRLVEVLAELRYNHLELYMEHTFAYQGHELVWGEASPLTSDELRDLDRRCAERGIELVANQNTFGHMERWLRHDEHRWRAECPTGATSPFTGRPMPPATLAPTPDNAEFAVGLVRELAGPVASPMVNIGADEPFELGQGASAPVVAARGRATVYLEHLNRLIEPLVADGRHVLFWGDVLRRHPELVAQLPTTGATAVVWNYEAPSEEPGLLAALGSELIEALGLPDDAHLGFEAHVRSFVETGYPFWVAAGTSGWNSLLGRWSNARANIVDAALVGHRHGSEGFLLTDWGDNGHVQPLGVSLLPLAYGAGVAWCAASNAGRDVTSVVDRLTGTPGVGSLLAEVGDLYLRPGVTAINGSPLFGALDPSRPLALIGRGDPDRHRATAAALDAALARLSAMGPTGAAAGWPIVDELTVATRLARHGAWRLARRAGADHPASAALAADAAECLELQRASWLRSSRPGGLTDSLRHLPEPDDL